jgi:capsular exopolysaccharide synthesis family protein
VELKDFLRVVRAHWAGIALITVLGVVVALAWTLVQPKVYTADASGIVAVSGGEEEGASFTNNSLATAKVPSYVELGSLRSVADYAIQELGLDTTPEALVNRVEVSNPTETLVIRVDAQGSSPEGARDLAEVWIRGMEREVNLLETGDAERSGEIFLSPRDSARLPASPSSPNTQLNLAVGLLAGLVLALGYALVRNYLDRRVRSVEDVEREAGVAVIGTVPAEKTLTDEDRLIIDPATGGSADRLFALSESLRALRTNIQFTDVDNPPQAIVITSPLPGDGKSTIAANLALTMAANGRRTVLIDGDLRRPMQSTVFNLPSGAGLTDVLAGRAELDDVVHPVGESGNLMVIAAGSVPPNPSEVLGSESMRRLIEEIREEAFVIIDAPPVVPVTDAAVLSTATDGAVVVATVGTTTYDVLGKALGNLSKVRGRALGVVLNRVPRKGMGAAYYGYQYSGKYYRSTESDSKTRKRGRDHSGAEAAQEQRPATDPDAARTGGDEAAARAGASPARPRDEAGAAPSAAGSGYTPRRARQNDESAGRR